MNEPTSVVPAAEPVVPSEPVSTQPPAVDPTPASPAQPANEPVPQPTETSTEEYELPDGRKVDAATLAREWKENFMPDYTRKSQALAQQQPPQQSPAINNEPQAPANPYADPTYIPQNYEEVIEVAKQRALAEIRAEREADIQHRAQIEQRVGAQLTELKTADPSLNENALFQHAIKYGFQDLKVAYSNMKDMAALAKNVQQTTAQNIQRRANEPVATQPGQANGTAPNPHDFANAREYLRSLK